MSIELTGRRIASLVADPDALRIDQDAVDFVRRFAAFRRPMATICHTSGTWVDEAVVVCPVEGDPLITSRKSGELDASCSTPVEPVAKA